VYVHLSPPARGAVSFSRPRTGCSSHGGIWRAWGVFDLRTPPLLASLSPLIVE